MHINKKEREDLRMMFGGRCAYCGCELNGKWHLDHVDPVRRDWEFVRNEHGGLVTNKNGVTATRATGKLFQPENDNKENMFPACVSCNIDKGASSLEDWRQYLHYRIVERLRVNSSTFRHAERFGVVTINPSPLVFWFEIYRKAMATDNTVVCT
jgi:5-methylcytosine-specific restriction endonuclease McrA